MRSVFNYLASSIILVSLVFIMSLFSPVDAEMKIRTGFLDFPNNRQNLFVYRVR